jgi:hypothetical protein
MSACEAKALAIDVPPVVSQRQSEPYLW